MNHFDEELPGVGDDQYIPGYRTQPEQRSIYMPSLIDNDPCFASRIGLAYNRARFSSLLHMKERCLDELFPPK